MELEQEVSPARVIYRGTDVFSVNENKHLQIRYGTLESPMIALQEQVPKGKTWEVHVVLSIEET